VKSPEPSATVTVKKRAFDDCASRLPPAVAEQAIRPVWSVAPVSSRTTCAASVNDLPALGAPVRSSPCSGASRSANGSESEYDQRSSPPGA
jgi:hypothetical protein